MGGHPAGGDDPRHRCHGAGRRERLGEHLAGACLGAANGAQCLSDGRLWVALAWPTPAGPPGRRPGPGGRSQRRARGRAAPVGRSRPARSDGAPRPSAPGWCGPGWLWHSRRRRRGGGPGRLVRPGEPLAGARAKRRANGRGAGLTTSAARASRSRAQRRRRPTPPVAVVRSVPPGPAGRAAVLPKRWSPRRAAPPVTDLWRHRRADALSAGRSRYRCSAAGRGSRPPPWRRGAPCGRQ